MKTYIIMLLSLIHINVFSGNGNEVGNGGDGVICNGGDIILLDYFEANKKGVALNYEKGNWFEIASNTLKRLSKKENRLYKQYSKVLSKINDRLKFISKSKFRDIKDSMEVSIPKGCKLVQLAIQQKSLFGKTVININGDLWKKLSNEQKAGLVLHEIIYEHFINLGEKNSIKVRKLNSFLASKKLQTMNAVELRAYLRGYQLSLY